MQCTPPVGDLHQSIDNLNNVTCTDGSVRVGREARGGGLIDTILSVEEVGAYKPHPKVYQLAVDRLAVPASAIAFQSSNAWDAHAAAAFGMQVVWCNRYGQRRERLPGTPDREVTSLAELPALVGAQPPGLARS